MTIIATANDIAKGRGLVMPLKRQLRHVGCWSNGYAEQGYGFAKAGQQSAASPGQR
ncbi:MAG: hypothetical protein JO163_18025 [Methylobacteriaceae bacterium]|nr:hypothetical protein [Methylobacteriaceae bacterium]MBV9704630.1 hypothetical protein [Methylobacteriaceae bacterium]